MATFRLKQGLYVGPEGTFHATKPEYPSTIESDKDLDEMYPNKWERLAGETKNPTRGRDTSPDASGRVMDDSPAEKAKKGMMAGHPLAKAKSATNSEKGKARRSDDSEEVDERDEPNETGDGDEEEVGSDFGKDVTENFEQAGKSDLKVFKRGTGKKQVFTVTDADDPTVAVNGTELKTVKDVDSFLKGKGK